MSETDPDPEDAANWDKRAGERTPFVNLSWVGMATERARPSRSSLKN